MNSNNYIPLEQRLEDGLRLMPSGCIEWTKGHDKDGYGLVKINGRSRRVHRVVWERENGTIPPGVMVLHHCDNPPCCNIKCLFLGTPVDNMFDMVMKVRGRNKQTHCKKGHRFSKRNTYVDPQGTRHCRKCRCVALNKFWEGKRK